MAQFVFSAKTLKGKLVKGQVEAGSDTEARVKIRAQQLIPIKIASKGGAASTSPSAAPKLVKGEKIKTKELQIFTRQFAVLIGAGVPVVQSLEAMLGGGKTPAMSKCLQTIVDDLERGRRLADAMAVHTNAFDTMYINLVKAGEEGGVLDQVLNRLAEYIEKAATLRGKIVGALWYPAAIVVVSFLVIAAIMTFVIPNFVGMFKQSGQELPALTKLVISISDFFVAYWYGIVGIIIAIPFSLKTYYGTSDGRKVIDKVLIKLPLFGSLIQKGAIARFSRTLSTLLGAGVRIMDSLDIAASTAGNYVLEQALLSSKESIARGGTMKEPLQRSKYIPDMVAQMMAVGEETGNLDIMLSKIADFYEDEVESASEAMMSLIEPMLMVVLGGIIAVLVIAMYLPIFTMAGAATGS